MADGLERPLYQHNWPRAQKKRSPSHEDHATATFSYVRITSCSGLHLPIGTSRQLLSSHNRIPKKSTVAKCSAIVSRDKVLLRLWPRAPNAWSTFVDQAPAFRNNDAKKAASFLYRYLNPATAGQLFQRQPHRRQRTPDPAIACSRLSRL